MTNDSASEDPGRHLVVTIHGIRTFGSWQERLETCLRGREPSIEVWNYKYGYFSVFALAVPLLRRLAIRRFRLALQEVATGRRWDRIDMVAHSFGTHLAAWGVLGTAEFYTQKVHTLIFAASALPRSFRVERLKPVVRRLVNDCARKDAVLTFGQVLLGVGTAGKRGLIGFEGPDFRNRFWPFGHSGFFQSKGLPLDKFMEGHWIGLLARSDPLPPAHPPGPHSLWEEVELLLLGVLEPAKYVAFGACVALLTWFLYATTDSHWTYTHDLRTGHFDEALALDVDESERFLASGDLGHLVFLWELEPDRSIAIPRALGLHNQAPVYDVALGPTSNPGDMPPIWAATKLGEIVRWQAENGSWTATRVPLFDTAFQVEVSPSGHTILAGGSDGRVIRLAAGLGDKERPSEVTRLNGRVVTLRYYDGDENYVALSETGIITFGGITGSWSRSCRLTSDRLRYGDVRRADDSWSVAAIEIEGSGSDERHRAVRWTLPGHVSDPRSGSCESTTPVGLSPKHDRPFPRSVRIADGGIYVGYYADAVGQSRLDLITPTKSVSRRFTGDVSGITVSPGGGSVYVSAGRSILRLPHPMKDSAPSLVSQPMQGDVSALAWLSEGEILVGTDAGDLWRWVPDGSVDVERILSGNPIVDVATQGRNKSLVAFDDGTFVELIRSLEGWRAATARRSDIGRVVELASCSTAGEILIVGSDGIAQGQREIHYRDAFPEDETMVAISAECWSATAVIAAMDSGDLIEVNSQLELRRAGKHPGLGTRRIVTNGHQRLAVIDGQRRLFLMKGSRDLDTQEWTDGVADSVYGVTFARGQDLLTVDGGYTLTIRDAQNGRAGEYRFGHGFDITAIEACPNGDHIAVGYGPSVRVYVRTTSSRITELSERLFGF